MLTVLGGLAQFECELIQARTDEGRKRAKARGHHLDHGPRVLETAKLLRLAGGSRDDLDTDVFSDSGPSHARRHCR